MKLVEIAPMASKEDKLDQILDYLEELKHEFAEIVDEYESENTDRKKLDILTEALDALEDAYDGVNEVVMDEL
jgi:hypothetical protein